MDHRLGHSRLIKMLLKFNGQESVPEAKLRMEISKYIATRKEVIDEHMKRLQAWGYITLKDGVAYINKNPEEHENYQMVF